MGARRPRRDREDHAVPDLGVDSDSGSEFINHHLLTWCEQRQITFTRSRPATPTTGCHVEQKNWAIVRTVVGYHRYEHHRRTVAAQQDRVLQSQLTNYSTRNKNSYPKSVTGAKVSKKYDTATAPHRRAERHAAVSDEDKAILAATYTGLNPAAVQRQIQALTAELLTITTSKAGPTRESPRHTAPSDEATIKPRGHLDMRQ